MKILSGIASVSKSLNLDLAQHFVRPDWAQTICIEYQQMTKVVTSMKQVNLQTLSLLHTEQTFFANCLQGEMQHKVAFHQGLYYLLRYKQSVSNSLNSDLAQHFVGPDWVQTVCKGYQQTTMLSPAGNILIYYGKCSKISNTLKLRTP